MIQRFKRLTFLLIVTSLTIAGYCEGETVYKINIKNGSSILVESYREVDGRIQFFRSGGFIEEEFMKKLHHKFNPYFHHQESVKTK